MHIYEVQDLTDGCICNQTNGRKEPHLTCNGHLVLGGSYLRMTCKQKSCQTCSRDFLSGSLIFIRPASTLLCLIVTGEYEALATFTGTPFLLIHISGLCKVPHYLLWVALHAS